LERVEWTGETPFEIKEINARPDGFLVTFTKPVDADSAGTAETFQLETFTHVYQQGYGSPEVDQTNPKVTSVTLSSDKTSALLSVSGLVKGHVHSFDLSNLKSADGEALVHAHAYYTLNEIPEHTHR
jgi:hypothetical protein